jgi:hypothetical protein
MIIVTAKGVLRKHERPLVNALRNNVLVSCPGSGVEPEKVLTYLESIREEMDC